jgi:hypothetical protein
MVGARSGGTRGGLQPADDAQRLSVVLQEVSMQLQKQHSCYPVFLGAELKGNYYRSE